MHRVRLALGTVSSGGFLARNSAHLAYSFFSLMHVRIHLVLVMRHERRRPAGYRYFREQRAFAPAVLWARLKVIAGTALYRVRERISSR